MDRNSIKEISSSDVRKLLIQHDPIFAIGNPEAQQNEYDLELPKVIEAIKDCDDYTCLRKKLRRIFSKTVGVFSAGTTLRYSKLARDLMKLK